MTFFATVIVFYMKKRNAMQLFIFTRSPLQQDRLDSVSYYCVIFLVFNADMDTNT